MFIKFNKQLSTKDILIIEDQDIDFLLIKEILEPTAVQFTRENTMDECMGFLKKHKPDLILINTHHQQIALPDFFQLLEKQSIKIPVLCMINYPFESITCNYQHINESLPKTLLVDKLVEKIQEIIHAN